VSEHQRHRHRESQPRRYLRTYKFEIVWLIVIALGIFLIFERLSIRSTVIDWLRRASAAALGGVGRLDELVSAFLARTTLSDVIGYVLIVGALAAIVMRVRWRVMRDPALASLRCPKCNGGIHREHRRRLDHFISFFVPVRRYRCANDQCRWCGLRVGTGHGESRASVRESL
jgi:hypothetical protein